MKATPQNLDTTTPVGERRATIPPYAYAVGITAFASVIALAVLTQGDRLTRLQLGPCVAEFNPA